jgi:alpha-ketoglutarate-dependent taurine dioxygenase
MSLYAPRSSRQELNLTIVDLTDLAADQREAEAQRRIRSAIRQPFKLDEGPLLRILLIHLNEEEHVLALVMHHIVSDAWSLGVLGREFAALYEAITSGKESPLPELKIQYADFAHWQRQWMQGEVLEKQLSYWRERLAGAPPLLRLPTDRPRPAVQSFAGAAHHFTLAEDLTAAVRSLSRRQRVTPFMTLLAAFKTFLYRYSGESDVVVGADIANRNRKETEDLIGFFINMLVLRTDLSGNPTFLELIERTAEATSSAYAHQDLPLERLVEELQPQRAQGYSPLFQVVFNYYLAPEDLLELSELSLSFMEFEHDVSKFDLSLFISESETGLGGHWRYSTALFDHSTVTRMHTLFETLLRSIVANPETRLNDLEMFPLAEREQRAAAKKELKRSNFDKFRSVKRKAISTSAEDLIETGYLEEGKMLPLVVRPRSDDVDLRLWAKENPDFVNAKLTEHGGILYRDFNIDSAARFEEVARAIAGELLDYSEPSSPRTEIGSHIYTSTEYPASQWIQLHNEMSYSHNWPHKVLFCCFTPAERGGQTPIAYSRRAYDLLRPSLRERFIDRRVMYVRNYSKNLDLPWQQVFHTTSRAAVEAHCRQTGIDFEWRGEDGLRTRQVRQAVLQHPQTGEMLWFNQAHAFHVAALEPAVREALRGEMKEEDFPRNAFYGDGSPIEDSVIEEIREAYRQASVIFDWQAHDVLLLENMLVAHGRAPFSGPRKILVAMGGLLTEHDVVERFEKNRRERDGFALSPSNHFSGTAAR